MIFVLTSLPSSGADKQPAQVSVHRIAILVAERDPIVAFSNGSSGKGTHENASAEETKTIVLKEGSAYRVELQFSVAHDIVLGLTYHDKIFKGDQEGVCFVGRAVC